MVNNHDFIKPRSVSSRFKLTLLTTNLEYNQSSVIPPLIFYYERWHCYSKNDKEQSINEYTVLQFHDLRLADRHNTIQDFNRTPLP